MSSRVPAQPREQNKHVKPFQFIPGKPQVVPAHVGEDKENEPTENGSVENAPVEAKSHQSENETRPPNNSQKEVPSTPATRLPLADLIGDPESTNCPKMAYDFSPEEHIQWKTVRSPQNSQSKYLQPRSNKRARSSSPCSSASKSASKRRTPQNGETLNLDGVKQSLKTPHTNPAADLWNRYATGSTNDHPLGKQIANLTNGMSSSPYVAAQNQAGNVSGLRRWTSCGVEWPSSKKKRRKLQHAQTLCHVEENFTDAPKQSTSRGSDSRNTARIRSLLDGLQQQKITQPNDVDDEDKGPSSSSPLPDRNEEFDRNSISPCRAAELASKVSKASPSRKPDERGALFENTNKSSPAGALPSSNFGSDSFEQELQQLAENQVPDARARSTSSESAFAPVPELDNEPDRAALADSALAEGQVGVEEDEFDYDFSAEDLNSVASMPKAKDPTSQAQNGSTRQNAGNVQSVSLPVDDMDDFGDDDIDEASFAAAEFSAKQAGKSSERGKSPVCDSGCCHDSCR